MKVWTNSRRSGKTSVFSHKNPAPILPSSGIQVHQCKTNRKNAGKELCEQASNEQDPIPLSELLAEIDRMLREENDSLNERRRSSATDQASKQPAAPAPPAASHPDPEVVARPQRRSYPAEYKVRILREAEAAAAIRGGIGALLRREGLYSSLLVNWRRERAQGIREALTPQKRGPKSKRHPLTDEMEKLQRKNAASTKSCAMPTSSSTSKKSGALLGHPLPDEDLDKES
jgi:transposase